MDLPLALKAFLQHPDLDAPALVAAGQQSAQRQGWVGRLFNTATSMGG